MPHGTRTPCLATALTFLLAAAPALGQEARATAQPAATEVGAGSSFADVLRLLVSKDQIAQVHADALLASEKAEPAGAVVNLARILAARDHLPAAGADAVAALAASPGGGSSARALAELLRVLLETRQLTPAEIDTLQTPDGVRRVTYVPELVRAQIREQVKNDLLEQMQREGWAAPKAFPEWTRRLTFKGDVRSRFERVMFRKSNAVGEFPDFNAINNGSPVDLAGTDFSSDRFLNVDRNRSRPRLRARLGLDAVVTRNVQAVLRLASGDGSSPVSTNQTLGGSAGNFSKYQFWLDRASLRWALLQNETGGLVLDAGRFANPFFTTDLIWDEDVNLDGLAVEADARLGSSLHPFLTAGAFPVLNTALSFGTTDQVDKYGSRDKWLLAAQLGAEYRPGPNVGLKLAAALYSFRNVEGRQSSPCDTNIKNVTCNTDITRPSFAQNGNTYRTIRTPSDAALAAEAAGGSRYQYFGLASSYRELAVTGRGDFRAGPALQLTVDAELVRNLAFRPSQVAPYAFNNRKACIAEFCPYGGGNMGYLGRFTLGTASTARRWDWSVWLAYRFLESDAVLDAFTDSDFGLGGTNLRGYAAGAALCPADNVTLSLRWYSASQVMGAPYGVDILQVDLGGRY